MTNYLMAAIITLASILGTAYGQEDPSALNCGASPTKPIGSFREVGLGSQKQTTFDGRGGMDSITIEGPKNFVLGRGKLISVERALSVNGQFDTLLVLGDFVHSSENHEVDIVSDEFDTIVLDPSLTWKKSLHPSGAFDVYTSTFNDEDITVLTAPSSFVVSSPPLPVVEAAEGTDGKLTIPTAAPVEMLQIELSETKAEISWPAAGAIRPNVGNLSPNIKNVRFNLENGAHNLIVLNYRYLRSRHLDGIELQADPFDTILLTDVECWTLLGHSDDLLATLSSEHQDGTSVRLALPKAVLERRALGEWRVGATSGSGLWLLSNDTRTALDAIDLRNDGQDILILRNDGALNLGHGFVFGDPGDEVWLEGASGWSISKGQLGTIAQLPNDQFQTGFGTLHFSPGLVIRKMPFPAFLNDPALLELSHYPGAPDKILRGSRLLVSRGGYVGFSPNQVASVERIALKNGSKNILLITPELLSEKTGFLTVSGDVGLDVVLAKGLGEAAVDESGRRSWQLDNEDGTLKIIVESLEVIHKQ